MLFTIFLQAVAVAGLVVALAGAACIAHDLWMGR